MSAEHDAGLGGGAYEPEAVAVLKSTNAVGVILLVINGNKGQGFSVATIDPTFPTTLPSLLRNMADEIERLLRQSAAS